MQPKELSEVRQQKEGRDRTGKTGAQADLTQNHFLPVMGALMEGGLGPGLCILSNRNHRPRSLLKPVSRSQAGQCSHVSDLLRERAVPGVLCEPLVTAGAGKGPGRCSARL